MKMITRKLLPSSLAIAAALALPLAARAQEPAAQGQAKEAASDPTAAASAGMEGAAAASKSSPIVPRATRGAAGLPRTEPHFVALRYPRDKQKAIAVVGSQTLTLEDLLAHIETRHYPDFRKLVRSAPAFQRYLRSDLMAPWVRQFADLQALQQAVGDDYIDPVELEKAQSASLKSSFEGFLGAYIEQQRLRGRPAPSQKAVDRLLRDFQLRRGLGAELQGMLDLIEKGDYNRKQLRDFFNDNARYFGGQVTVEHLLVQHRDSGTGLLLNTEGMARANARVAEIQAQLRPDGSNFEDLVRRYSDDTKTAQDGGKLYGVRRFDDRLPAQLCRAAWAMRDGQVTTDVVESQYGWHFMKRLEFSQQVFILFTDDAIPSIRLVMRRAMQEKRLFGARRAAKLRLLL
ncbi:MAG: peptidylprolyl isomerase [Planctomycetota bacterium]